MSRLISCSRCGRIHSDSIICKPLSNKRRFTDTAENKLRSRYSWKKKRENVRERANYLCEVCRANGDYSPKDIEIHHITKLRDDPNGLLEDNNLIALCIEHHKQADRGEIDADYLRRLADERDEIETAGGEAMSEGTSPRGGLS